MSVNPVASGSTQQQEKRPQLPQSYLHKWIPKFGAVSPYRQVFQTTDQMKQEFGKFLQTIFYQLDEEKVLEGMAEILENPDKTDEEIYKELLEKIGAMKKKFAPLWQNWSLGVLKDGMGSQAAKLLKGFRPSAFNDYMEIYDRRYLKDIRKKTGFPLNGNTVAAVNRSTVNLVDRIQASAVFSSYPYKTHIPLNDPNCENPAEHPEQTSKPIGEEIADKSLDLIGCFGGLHHISAKRVDPFVASLNRTLRPGAVLLMRDHNVKDNAGSAKLSKGELSALISMVHTFVNASDGASWKVESKEIRDFKSINEWVQILKKHNFTCISPSHLVLKDDPTENGMIALVRNPESLEEMKEALQYRSDCDRGKDGTRATWIEWGNVRFSKQYAEFIQTHHSYAFDNIGHLRQHWQHFAQYIRESLNDNVPLMKLIFSGNFTMNFFILFTAAIQCAHGTITSLPQILLARWQHGENWREVSNLTFLEKYTAKVEKEYSEFIDHTPFYMFDYTGRIKGVWEAVLHSKEGMATKAVSALNAIRWSFGMTIKAAIAAPVRTIYTAEVNFEPDTVKALIKDPKNELAGVINRWEKEKNPLQEVNTKIEEIYSTPDGYKLVSIPRYRPFTKICEYFSETSKLEVLEVGGQKNISIDVILDENATSPKIKDARLVYKMKKLQDPQKRHYETYYVALSSLKEFLRSSNVEYIHE